jgi:hypothetical protein
MKALFVALTLFAGLNASAAVTQIKGRVAGGMVNPKLGPFGAIVNMKNGEVLYVTGVISVLAPKDLDPSCIYSFSTIPDTSVSYKAIRLVTPLKTLSCGHDFPKDR